MSGVANTFKIPAENVEWFEAQIAKLSKKSVKLLGEQFAIKPFYFGYELVDEQADGTARKVYEVLLTAEQPKLDGWEFVATLDHSNKEVGNIVRVMPGKTLPSHYHNAASGCDHCRVRRFRRDTYVVRHDDGTYKQIGSTCLNDFMGHDVAKIARLAEILGIAAETCRAAGERFYGADLRSIRLDIYLGHVAKIIRTSGWVSKSEARNSGKAATANVAHNSMLACDDVTETDKALAERATEWAQNLSVEECQRNDYLHNINVLAASGAIEKRSIGYAASIVSSYMREEQRANAPKWQDRNIENVAGIVELMNRPKKSQLKDPMIRVRVGDQDLRLSINQKGAYKGSVAVNSLGSYSDRTWYGSINPTTGKFFANPRIEGRTQTAVLAALKALAADPVGVAAAYGRLTGRCCFCNKPLSDERSVAAGYGGICAGHYNYPYPSLEEARAILAERHSEKVA